MVAPICGIVTTTVGTILLIVFLVVGYVIVPDFIVRILRNEIGLIENTLQMDRFENIPVTLDFKARLFEILNPDEVVNNGVPIVKERGPYIYKLTRSRLIENMDEEFVNYTIKDQFVFDKEASYPATEDDMIMLINPIYHLILQLAESDFTTLIQLIGGDAVLRRAFGDYYTPVAKFRVGDILFDGVRICTNPILIATVFCVAIRASADRSENIQVAPNGDVVFSFFAHKQGIPGRLFTVNRGTVDISKLGLISFWNNNDRLTTWPDVIDETGEAKKSVCNKLNGTDTGVFPPFVDTSQPIYGFNADICRSVELRFVRNDEYKGVPVAKYSADEFFLDNDEGCFCVGRTTGLTKQNGCLHRGAIELFNCVGGYIVLTYPHFLFAHSIYRNGVVGVVPIEEEHKVMVDLEQTSGVVIRGAKRAQFNLFSRPIRNVTSSTNLRTTLVPIFWVHEGMELPQRYVDEIKERLFQRLNTVEIVIPILIAIGALVMLLGLILIILRCRPKSDHTLNK